MMPFVLGALSKTERLRAMRQGFVEQTDQGSDLWLKLFGLLVAAALCIALLYVLNRLQKGKAPTLIGDTWKLFREAMKSLSIRLTDRNLLQHVAGELKLVNPTSMLLSSEIYTTVAYDYMVRSPGKKTRAELSRLAAIHEQVFNCTMPPPPRTTDKAPRP